MYEIAFLVNCPFKMIVLSTLIFNRIVFFMQGIPFIMVAAMFGSHDQLNTAHFVCVLFWVWCPTEGTPSDVSSDYDDCFSVWVEVNFLMKHQITGLMMNEVMICRRERVWLIKYCRTNPLKLPDPLLLI